MTNEGTSAVVIIRMEKEKPTSTGAIDYGNLGYWDTRYAQKQGERFEWL